MSPMKQKAKSNKATETTLDPKIKPRNFGKSTTSDLAEGENFDQNRQSGPTK